MYRRFQRRVDNSGGDEGEGYDNALATNPETVYAAMAETVWEYDDKRRQEAQ